MILPVQLSLSIKNKFFIFKIPLQIGYLNLWHIFRLIFRQHRMTFFHKLCWQKKKIFFNCITTLQWVISKCNNDKPWKNKIGNVPAPPPQPLLRKATPAPYLQTLFKNFQIPPSPLLWGRSSKFTSPTPFKKKGGSELYVGDLLPVMLLDLSVAIMQVTVSLAIMQLEVSAALMQITISAANMWVTIFMVIMQVGVFVAAMLVVFSAIHYAHDCFYCNYVGDCFKYRWQLYSYVDDSFKEQLYIQFSNWHPPFIKNI